MSVSLKLKETNSNPLVIHANGKSSRDYGIYNKIKSTFINNQEPISLDENIDVTIVTWKGGKYANQETILETCMRFYDYPILILDWPKDTNFWEGSKSKVTETLKAINNGLVDTEYVMWFDAGDVMLMNHPKYILDGYFKYFSEFDLVFNAEKNNYPRDNRLGGVDSELVDRFHDVIDFDESKTHGTSYKYLNSGCLVGKTDYLKKFLEHASTIGMDQAINDTVMCRIAQYDMKDRVTVDNKCKLFVCLYDVGETEMEVIIDE